MGGRRRKLIREFTGVLKDKASMIKATLSIKRTHSTIKVAILRATTHSSSTSPPPDHLLEDILSLSGDVPPAACACIDSIMERLHRTRNPHVALKCLLILHNILTQGSVVLKEQLSYHPSHGGQNFLNLARFGDNHHIRDVEIWELSQWVRWYALVLERNLISSRTLGCYININNSSSSSFPKFSGIRNEGRKKSNCSLDFGLLIQEMDSLVFMVEAICEAPESLEYQKMDLVHQLMLLVSEDYRGTQYHIISILSEFRDDIETLSPNDSSELLGCLKRLEGCRERLTEMFGNRKRNNEFWELTNETRRKIEEMNERRERGRMVVWNGHGGGTEVTRNGKRVKGASQVLKLLPYNSSQTLRVERV